MDGRKTRNNPIKPAGLSLDRTTKSSWVEERVVPIPNAVCREGIIRMRLALFVLVVSFLSGCVSMPSRHDQNYSSAKVGDRASYDFNKVVVMVPSPNAPEGFLNLHIQLSAAINPKRVTLAGHDEVRDIVWRMFPRLAATVTETVQAQPDPLSDLKTLREKIRGDVERVFRAEFCKWAFADDYEVRIEVVSMHFTNGSVEPRSESAWRYY